MGNEIEHLVFRFDALSFELHGPYLIVDGLVAEGRSKKFISYSRQNLEQVVCLCELMELDNSTLFRDAESIEPGTFWRLAILTAIERCDRFYLFWSAAAAGSREVRREYEHALRLGKLFIPILLDDTPLPEPLTVFQAIDLTAATLRGKNKKNPPCRAGQATFFRLADVV